MQFYCIEFCSFILCWENNDFQLQMQRMEVGCAIRKKIRLRSPSLQVCISLRRYTVAAQYTSLKTAVTTVDRTASLLPHVILSGGGCVSNAYECERRNLSFNSEQSIASSPSVSSDDRSGVSSGSPQHQQPPCIAARDAFNYHHSVETR